MKINLRGALVSFSAFLLIVIYQNCDGKFNPVSSLNSASGLGDAKDIQEAQNSFKVCREVSLENAYSQVCDLDYVYYNGQTVQEASLREFELLNQHFGKDGSKVYYNGNELIGANPDRFQLVSEFVGRDNRSLFYGNTRLAGANINDITIYPGGTLVLSAGNLYYKNAQISNEPILGFKALGGSYWMDNDGVYFGDDKITANVNISTFKVLGEYYGADSENVYFRSDIVNDADPATFKELQGDYGMDSQRVFVGALALSGAEPSTFVKLNTYYAKDANQVYYRARIVPNVDIVSFKTLYGGLAYDKNSFYIYGQVISGVIPEVNPQPLGLHTYKNGGRIYQMGVEIMGLDVNTFKFIDAANYYDKDSFYSNGIRLADSSAVGIRVLGAHTIVGNQVYCRGQILPNANGTNFRRLNQFFYTDEQSLYINCRSSTVENPNSLIAIDEEMYTDGVGVYGTEGLIANADPNTFEVFSRVYYKDINRVYFIGTEIEGANPNTFKLLFSRSSGSLSKFSSDGTNFYYGSNILDPELNYTGFKTLLYGYAKSNTQVFRSSNPMEADPVTFEVLTQFYAKDQNNVYYLEEVLEGAVSGNVRIVGGSWLVDAVGNLFFQNKIVPTTVDLATFKANLNSSTAEDINNTYRYDFELQQIVITPK